MADIPAVRCPACAKKFKTKADVRGKRIRCPFCTESFIVPVVEEETDDDDAPIPIKGEASGPARDDDTRIPMKGELKEEEEPIALQPAATGEEGEDPYAVTHLDLAPRCPNCAHEMPSATAVVCLNCGYNTLTREWGKTEKTIGISFGRHMAYLLPGFLALFGLIAWGVLQLCFIILWPHWVAGTWMDFSDHESLRMWSTTVGMGLVFALGRYCYIRFMVKPLPEELKAD